MGETPKYVTRWIKVGPLETEKKNFLIKGTHTVKDEHFGAIDDLAFEIARVCNELDAEGYDVISVLPTVRGKSQASTQAGYGYSVSDGAIITAKRIG
ncbi:MAG: hypothetical protein COA43_12245 [Robiginitomaculum sp.]|nr:MAG: hypothetical protein COA43_12245 [Robiginitomaculum sp.]